MNRITLEEFVSLLGISLKEGREKGILEEKDVTFASEYIVKRDAARIMHEFLKRILNEKDTDDYKEALLLKDIYDCHICVNHIAQVYSKGIMEAENKEEDLIFNNNKSVTYEETLEYASRVFDPSLRNKRSNIDRKVSVGKIRYREAIEKSREDSSYVIIDVRPKSVIEKTGYRFTYQIPFTEIAREGKKALGDLYSPQATFLLYCENGYLSEVAANALFLDGVDKVCYFGND